LCTVKSILGNLSKNAFILFGKSSDFVQVVSNFPAKSLDELNS
jgi:hypothetical protein